MILHQCLLIIVCIGGEPEYLTLMCHHSRVPERPILEERGSPLILLIDWRRHLFYCLLIMVKEEEQDLSEDR